MQIILKIGIFIYNLIYCFHKLAPTRNRVAAISRQSETLTPDMKLLTEEIRRQDPDIEVITLNRMIPPDMKGRIRYIFYMLGTEMHVIATSRVLILEGYCIGASVLHHKKSLKIIQMWHALGALKKFGYLAVDTEEGHSSRLARTMHMHENYDYVLCSSEFCRPIYAAAFGYPEDKVRVMPLPRTDLLKNEAFMAEQRRRIYDRYPELREKPSVLYAPTFRKGADISAALQELMDAFPYDKYNLIVHLHPIDRTKVESDRAFQCPEFTSLELYSVSAAMISDYSSAIFEAAQAWVPVYLYTYDLDEYLERRGFCIDFMKDIPLPKYRTAGELLAALERGDSSPEEQAAFLEKYVKSVPDSTGEIAAFVRSLVRNT